jgi:hypothetical protein
MIETTVTRPAARGKTNVRQLRFLLLIVRELIAPATSREFAARLRSYGRR